VSVSELYTDLTSTAGSAGATAPTAPAPVQDTQFLQYASARRIDRLEQEQALIDIVLRGPEQPSESSGARHSPVASMFSADMLRVLTDARRVRGE
jgi:hypothetical protein